METNVIKVTKPSLPKFEEFVSEISKIWENHWLTNFGPRHIELREKLKDTLGVEGLTLFTNGHLALEAAIEALGLTGEVITTPFTFVSTTHAIARNGLTPVFCDIDKETYCMDVTKIEELITEKTSAILPVHVYGTMCDVNAIEKIAKQYNLKVIYDAAHAFGVELDGVGVGAFGDAAMYSFHATKVFNTIEGGAVAYSDPKLEKTLIQLQNFGFGDTDDVELIGANAKMNEFQAAMGLCNLKNIHQSMSGRKSAFEQYLNRLNGVQGLILPRLQENVKANYSYFHVQVEESQFGENRESLLYRLAQKNIYTRKYFSPLTNSFRCYGQNTSTTPIAQFISESILVLPLYEDLQLSDVDRICDIILEGH